MAFRSVETSGRGSHNGEHGSDDGEKATASIDRGITVDSHVSAPPPHYGAGHSHIA